MASRRFEGAVTTPEDGGLVTDSSLPPPPERPPRPILIELASAILVVGGMVGVLGTVGLVASGIDQGLVGSLVLVLNVLTVLVGLLIRAGRAWVLAVNVVAVALFLELTALPSTFAIVLSVLDAVVLFTLIRYRSWFDWRPTDGAAASSGTGVEGAP